MNFLFAFLTGWELVALIAIILLLFGAKRLPGLARGLGEGVREFKKGSVEEKEEKLKKDKSKTEFI